MLNKNLLESKSSLKNRFRQIKGVAWLAWSSSFSYFVYFLRLEVKS